MDPSKRIEPTTPAYADRSQNFTAPSPLLAGLLTLLHVGLGHVYLGTWKRAIAWFLTGWVVVLLGALMLLNLPLPHWNVVVPLAIGVLYLIRAVVDAVRVARRTRPGPRASPAASAFVVVAVLLVALFLLQPLFLRGLRSYVLEVFELPTSSMGPTLASGDRILADKLAYAAWLGKAPRRGDLIVYRSNVRTGDAEPPDSSIYLKRVIGLGGETILIRNDTVYVDGRALDEPYARTESGPREQFGPLEVPRGSYFVLGDARRQSLDSRSPEHGTVLRADVLGRVRVVLYAAGERPGGTRRTFWQRLGLRVDGGPTLAPEE
ncbi:MAG: signal peptidase I [Planctomycetota bacterium]|jgi:signal peptidase I